MRANFVVSGVAAGIRRNAAMTIALILSTAIALGFVGAAILANTEISKFKTTYEDKINISVYLCTGSAYDQQQTDNELAKRERQPQRTVTCSNNVATTAAQIAAVRRMLTADPMVDSARFVSEQKALDLGKKQQPTLASYLKIGDLPASFTVKLRDLKNDYAKFAIKYDQVSGVDKVNNQISTIQTLLSMIDSARWFSIVIALVVLIASILLIANTIQVAANQRRNETSIMRLVGASRWMTELPFMLETIIAVVLGGLIAIGFIGLGKHFVLDGVFAGQTRNGVIPNLSINDILIAGGAGLIVGIVLSGITAFITLRLYVRL
ncbi:MAG: permease-like cell division protein FtsX [Actinomycetota bacterium]|nr:permease-like cell division protein FtsX [Actinomycetota bacterium]